MDPTVILVILVVVVVIIGIIGLNSWINYLGNRPKTPIERRYREIQENQQREQLYAQQQHQAQAQAASQRALQAYQDKYWCHHIMRGGKHCSYGAYPQVRTTHYGGDEEVYWKDWNSIPQNMYICDDCNQWFCNAHIVEGSSGSDRSHPESLYGAHTGLCYECAVARRKG